MWPRWSKILLPLVEITWSDAAIVGSNDATRPATPDRVFQDEALAGREDEALAGRVPGERVLSLRCVLARLVSGKNSSRNSRKSASLIWSG